MQAGGLSVPRSRATSKALPHAASPRARAASQAYEVARAEFVRTSSQIALEGVEVQSVNKQPGEEGEDAIEAAARSMLTLDTSSKEATAESSRNIKQAAGADTNLSSLTFQSRPIEAEVSAMVRAVSELNVLPTANKYAPLTGHDLLLAHAYLFDSIHCRSLNHGRSPRALEAYFRQHHQSWKAFVSLIAWLHIALGFIEPPSSIKLQGVPYGPSHAACGAIELCFFAVYATQILFQIRSYDQPILSRANGFWRSHWRAIKVPVLIVCVIDILVSMGRNEAALTSSGIHASQFLRVIFVIEQSGRIRQLTSCILHSLPVILSIMWLILVHCLTFAMIGYVALGPLEEPSVTNPQLTTKYFDTVGRSIISCIVLVTSENFPDVMLPAYRHHWFSCIFFLIFLIIGLYGLIQVTVAVVFHSFRAHTKTKLATALVYQEAGLQKAFETLARVPMADQKNAGAPSAASSPMSKDSSFSADSFDSPASPAPVISLSSWTALMRLQRPHWTASQVRRIYDTAVKPEQEEEERRRRWEMDQEMEGAAGELSPSSAASSSSSFPKCAGLNFDQFDHAVAIAQFDEFPFPSSGDNSATGSAANLRQAPAPVEGCFDWRAWWRAFLDLAVRYFVYRIPIHPYVLVLLGRTQSHIEERQAEEWREEQAHREEKERLLLCAIPPSAEGPTPLHPKIDMRERLSTMSLCELMSDLMTIAHAFLVIARMTIDDPTDDTSQSTLSTLDSFTVLLEVIFVVDVATRLFLCRRKFFSTPLQVFDFITVSLLVICQIAIWSGSYRSSTYDVLSALRITRLLRLYHRVTSFTLLLQVVQKIGPPLGALLAILYLLIYSYAIIGMAAFFGELTPEKIDPVSDYAQGDYFALHFNDLARGLITLYWQLCTNNWYLLMDVLYANLGFGARVYFISFYCLSVLIVFNVCTALVVEAYVELHEEKEERRLLGKKHAHHANAEGAPAAGSTAENGGAGAGSLSPLTTAMTPASAIGAPSLAGNGPSSVRGSAIGGAAGVAVHAAAASPGSPRGSLPDQRLRHSSAAITSSSFLSSGPLGSATSSGGSTSEDGIELGSVRTRGESGKKGNAGVGSLPGTGGPLSSTSASVPGKRDSGGNEFLRQLTDPPVTTSRVPRAGPKHLMSLMGKSDRQADSPQTSTPSAAHTAAAKRFATLQAPAHRAAAQTGLSVEELKRTGPAFPNLVSKIVTMSSSSARRSNEASTTGRASIVLPGNAAGSLMSSAHPEPELQQQANTFTSGDTTAASTPGAPSTHDTSTSSFPLPPLAPASESQRRASLSFPASFPIQLPPVSSSAEVTPQGSRRGSGKKGGQKEGAVVVENLDNLI